MIISRCNFFTRFKNLKSHINGAVRKGLWYPILELFFMGQVLKGGIDGKKTSHLFQNGKHPDPLQIDDKYKYKYARQHFIQTYVSFTEIYWIVRIFNISISREMK